MVIFFTGWSTSEHIASLFNLPEGYDLIICWDYREPSWQDLKREYDEVLIFAWSFGIPIAEQLYERLSSDMNVTGVFAINGSRNPVDNESGIPENIFNDTVKYLNETNLKKFKIRITGGVRKYVSLETPLSSNLSLEELKDELENFRTIKPKDSEELIWDCVYISDEDKIFPKENLKKAWRDTAIFEMSGENHLPDFSKIFAQAVKDKKTIRKNFERTHHTYDETAIVQKSLSLNLVDLLHSKSETFSSILELGSGSGYLSKLLKETFNPKRILLMDLSSQSPLEDAEFITGDIETMINSISKDSFELVVSGSALQWFHSPSRIVSKVFSILKKDGIFGFTTYLPDTFKEIKSQTGSGLLYYSQKQWESIAEKCGFEILDSLSETIELKFGNVSEIFDHIKSTGVNSLNGPHKGVGEMRKIISNYPRVDGKYILTYNPLTMVLKKK